MFAIFGVQDRNSRDHLKDHPYYQDCIDFCASWDQPSFDPEFKTQPLEHFIPLIQHLFARTPKPLV